MGAPYSFNRWCLLLQENAGTRARSSPLKLPGPPIILAGGCLLRDRTI